MRRFFLLLATFVAISMQSSYAATSTVNNKATATIVATCQLSATNITFGQIGTTSGTYTTTNGSISVFCSKNAPYTISASYGSTNPSWSIQTLTLYMGGPVGGSSNYMPYELCINPDTPSANVGTGSYGGITKHCNGYIFGLNTLFNYIKGTGNGATQTWGLNAAVPNSYNYYTGNYSDTNTMTVSF